MGYGVNKSLQFSILCCELSKQMFPLSLRLFSLRDIFNGSLVVLNGSLSVPDNGRCSKQR